MKTTPNKVHWDQVTTRDGATIAFRRLGHGSPLIVVHGAGAANALTWRSVTPKLAQHFSVYAVDRRGHGQSRDGPSYSLDREFEDLAVLVDAIGEWVSVLGHSLGGLIALEAALLTPYIDRLVLYEPLSLSLTGMPIYPPGFIARLQAQVDIGDQKGALSTFYQEFAKRAGQREAVRVWPGRLATAHTLPRELRADERYRFDPYRFQALQTPTLLLEGGDSRDFEKAGNAAVSTALPDCRIVVLPDQQHIAMYTAPDLFLQIVLGFLKPLDGAS